MKIYYSLYITVVVLAIIVIYYHKVNGDLHGLPDLCQKYEWLSVCEV